MKEELARIRKANGRRPMGQRASPGDRVLDLTRQVERLRWELSIARRDERIAARARRVSLSALVRAERHIYRLEGRIGRIVRTFRAYREGKPIPTTAFVRRPRAGKRRTWLSEGLERTALPAHRWEALKSGGFIR